MLLTDSLIDELHSFRVGMMQRSIEAVKTVRPHAKGMPMGSGYASFSGDGSPTTSVYGIGHRDTAFDLDEIDRFYEGNTSNWELIVTPFMSQAVLAQATKMGYVPDHFESVLVQIAEPTEVLESSQIRIEKAYGDLAEWMQVTDAAWAGRNELLDEISDISRLMAAAPATRYMAYFDGTPAATASLIEFQGKFLFAGACTLPKFREQGLQRALTHRRLVDSGRGSLVQVVALPGSQSHRNLQRVGFNPAYSKLVLFRR